MELWLFSFLVSNFLPISLSIKKRYLIIQTVCYDWNIVLNNIFINDDTWEIALTLEDNNFSKVKLREVRQSLISNAVTVRASYLLTSCFKMFVYETAFEMFMLFFTNNVRFFRWRIVVVVVVVVKTAIGSPSYKTYKIH